MIQGVSSKENVVPKADYTASFNSNSYECGGYTKAMAYMDVGLVSGTSPTLDVKIQESPDNSAWYDTPGAAFPRMTTAGKQRLMINDLGGMFYRASVTIGGTNPKFNFSIDCCGKR